MSFVKTPTGVVMHANNHQRAVELAKKYGNKGWLEMLEPAEPFDNVAAFSKKETR